MHWIFFKYLVILLVGCGFGGFRFLGRYTYLHAPVAPPVDGDVSVKLKGMQPSQLLNGIPSYSPLVHFSTTTFHIFLVVMHAYFPHVRQIECPVFFELPGDFDGGLRVWRVPIYTHTHTSCTTC